MKKLVFALAALCVAATPVLACDGHDKPADAAAPKTADKAKKEAPKADKAKETDTAKAKPAEKKAPEKKADKVSQR